MNSLPELPGKTQGQKQRQQPNWSLRCQTFITESTEGGKKVQQRGGSKSKPKIKAV